MSHIALGIVWALSLLAAGVCCGIDGWIRGRAHGLRLGREQVRQDVFKALDIVTAEYEAERAVRQ